MKLTVAALLALLGALASASPVNTVAKTARGKSSNLLQASRSGQPLAEVVQSNPCFGAFFCPESNLAGAKDGTGPAHGVDFFTKDFEKMDELPNYVNQKKKQCHPKCRWTCGTSHCNSLCEPRCKPPKCVTACKKVSLAKCKRTCKDPQCAVVCPPQCEHGMCPKCKTVCGESVCSLQSGKALCESTCADPDCVWDCKPNPVCAKPTCQMKCDEAVCSFGPDQKLPNDHEVPYMGQEIAWKGLGKIPEEHLAEFAPETFSKPKMPEGAKMFGGAEPVPKAGMKSLTGETGITMEAEKDGPTRWVASTPQKNMVLAPSALTPR